MDDFSAHFAAQGQTQQQQAPDARSIDSDRLDIIYNDNENPGRIVTHAPKERFRLGYFDVMCLVINFMIGTGVFNSHTRVMQGTDSTGAALLLWLAGIVYCLCGTHVYIEYGLNVPRYTLNGVEQSVPRSGGDLNYLQYVYQWPAYRPGTIQLSTCLFGVGFIAFGNMAGNAINFASKALLAAGVENPNNAAVRWIAIAVATLTCFIHAFSRRGGILLNNFFAIIKISILFLIVILAIVVAAGGFETKSVIEENTNAKAAFDSEYSDANGYAHAFLAVIFSFWGFEQPNYIMGEISHPKRKFPIAMTIGVVLICTLYMAVTISYMVVVPKDDQKVGVVAQTFFDLTLGSLGHKGLGSRIFNAFIAISSIGNMIVMTYTAARVKQEVAKEGILPYPKFFAQNTDLSLGRVLKWLRHKGYFSRLLAKSWLLPEHHSEKTPAGAFVLHFFSCLILIFATWGMTPDAAYDLLTTLSVYVINCFFGFFIGLGILILRWKGPPDIQSSSFASGAEESEDATHQQQQQPPPPPQQTSPKTWRQLTGPGINPYLSVFCASFFTLCNAWPVITTWVPPTVARMREGEAFGWWLIPTVAWAVIVLGVAWYLGFLAVARNMDRKHHQVFVVEKKPEFESDEGHHRGGDGGEGRSRSGGDEGLVLIHETTYLAWVGKETLSRARPDDMFEMGDHASGIKPNNYVGTDFDGYFREPQQPQQMQQVPSHGSGYEGHQHPSPLPPQGAFQPHLHPPQPQPSLHQSRPPHWQQHQPQEHFAQSPYQQQESFSQHPQSHQQPPRGYSNHSYRH